MFKSKQVKILFPVFIALIFSGFSLGESPKLMKGLSPYNSAAIQFEEKAFVRIMEIAKQNSISAREAEKQKIIQAREAERETQLNYEEKVTDKIRQLITKYQIQIYAEHIQEIPKSILAESKIYDYDPMFLTALIITESSFNSRARSNRGALGLMQIVPRTGVALAREKNIEWKGSQTLYNPYVNIELGAYYLNKLHNRFGDLNLALEAYNHGPTKLAEYLKRGYQPRSYSNKVLEIYEMIDVKPT